MQEREEYSRDDKWKRGKNTAGMVNKREGRIQQGW